MFLHEIWPERRAHYVNYENINNSNFDGMSLASFCQSRAELIVYMQGQLDNTHRDSGINICIIEQISYKI